jgi:hypothetical protein
MRRIGAQCKSDGPFKRCTLCSHEWRTRDDFLNDRENHFDGYQYVTDRVREGLPVEGLLIFTHRHWRCGTSLAILASRFKSKELDKQHR